MKSPGTKLSRRDRDVLLEQLAQQACTGPKSSEVFQRVVSDRSGVKLDLGGQSHGVFVDEYGTPGTISEEHVKFLDCGHTVTSFADVLGKCAYGHILCKRHELYRCVKCSKILCEIEAVFDEEGQPNCPDHDSGFSLGKLLGFLIALALVFFILASIN